MINSVTNVYNLGKREERIGMMKNLGSADCPESSFVTLGKSTGFSKL